MLLQRKKPPEGGSQFKPDDRGSSSHQCGLRLPAIHKRKPGTPARPFVLSTFGGSVLRDHRTTPVEAVNEFGRGLLLVDVAGLEYMCTHNAAIAGRRRQCTGRAVGLVVEFGEANFVLPEQAGNLTDGVFRAATNKVPTPGLAPKHQSSVGAEPSIGSEAIDKVGLLHMLLGVTSVEIRQKTRKRDIADAAASRPRPVILVLAGIRIGSRTTITRAGEGPLAAE
jgi:hypothetical protein